jgi:hypothetical protein
VRGAAVRCRAGRPCPPPSMRLVRSPFSLVERDSGSSPAMPLTNAHTRAHNAGNRWVGCRPFRSRWPKPACEGATRRRSSTCSGASPNSRTLVCFSPRLVRYPSPHSSIHLLVVTVAGSCVCVGHGVARGRPPRYRGSGTRGGRGPHGPRPVLLLPGGLRR